ncbi:hypothetical protein GEMRC1_004201 [Eukaryota sp. GEM-RC1]
MLFSHSSSDGVVTGTSIVSALKTKYPDFESKEYGTVAKESLKLAFEVFPQQGFSIIRIDSHGSSNTFSTSGKYYISPLTCYSPSSSETAKRHLFIRALTSVLISRGGRMSFNELNFELTEAEFVADQGRSKIGEKFSTLVNFAKKLGIITLDKNKVIHLNSSRFISDESINEYCRVFDHKRDDLMSSYEADFQQYLKEEAMEN